MRIGVALLVQAAVLSGCAAHEALPPAADSNRRTHAPPHACAGADIGVHLPDGARSLDAILRLQEPAPEPPDRPPTGEEAISAVKQAIEGAIPEIRCRFEDQYYQALRCAEEDSCHTSMLNAQGFAKRIRELVTPAVEVGAYDCACRIYSHRGDD